MAYKEITKQKENQRKYYLKNKEYLLLKAKKRRIKNPNLQKEYIERCGHEKFANIQRKSYLKRLYNITLEEYEKKLKEQNYSCAICKRHQSKFKKKLHVDHNHKTGKVRDILCAGCNVDVSVVEDRLKELQEYLNKHREKLN
jgi:hypothetical protein